ncbi:MAG: DNA repair protein RecO [Hyphomicrobiales bacterium]
MQWSDEAIILGARRHGEGSVILEVMTAGHGRHLGLVRGGRSRRMQAALQPGNAVDLVWRARLDEHLGNFTVEPTDLRAARLMETPVATYGVLLLAAHLRLLPERDPHPELYAALRIILDELHEPLHAGALVVRFEMALLDELGFGLDLSECAATGTAEDLVWVSPRSGRAVSRAAGEPYAAKLLPLPGFLAGGAAASGDGIPAMIDETATESGLAPRSIEAGDIHDGFRLTEFFLTRHVLEPRGIAIPEARAGFLKALARALGG